MIIPKHLKGFALTIDRARRLFALNGYAAIINNK